jgi:hypothetical protein
LAQLWRKAQTDRQTDRQTDSGVKPKQTAVVVEVVKHGKMKEMVEGVREKPLEATVGKWSVGVQRSASVCA